MKAAVIHEHGDLSCVLVEEVADPRPAAEEAVVAVRSAGLNHLDIWVRKGRPGGALAMPHVLGSDAAGVVCEVGSRVRGLQAGDEVILNPGLNCGTCEFCRRGQQSECSSFGLVGLSRPGTFAEKTAVPAGNLYPKPKYLSFRQAAALPLAYVTAWRMLMNRGALRAGETVFIHGIGGGVALAGLQLAKRTGARVLVSSSSDTKLEKAHQLGADFGINYRTANVTEGVMDFTCGRGVDLVMDTVGAATWEVDFGIVRKAGRIVLCGITTGSVAETNLQKLYWNQLTVMGSTMGSDEDFRQMLNAAEAAQLKPIVDSVTELEYVREAMGKMERGEQFGKIVLDVSS